MINFSSFREPTDAYFKKSVKDIGKNSRDITSNYKYKTNIGLAIANKYSEKGREYYHIICKQNVKYNKDKCDKEYSGFLKIKDNRTNLADFYQLYSKDLMIRYEEMMKEFEKENKANKQSQNEKL